jgi:hypothetical protein
MPFHVIAHLVTHPRREGELAAVLQRRMQFTLKTQKATAVSSMVGSVVRKA